MGSKADRFTKLVDRYQRSAEAQGRMKAIGSASQRIADIEAVGYEADLTIKEAKNRRKAVKAQLVDAQAKMDEAMAALTQSTAEGILANLQKLSEDAAANAAAEIVKGKSQ